MVLSEDFLPQDFIFPLGEVRNVSSCRRNFELDQCLNAGTRGAFEILFRGLVTVN